MLNYINKKVYNYMYLFDYMSYLDTIAEFYRPYRDDPMKQVF